MIDVTKLTPAQIRQMGIEALTKALGNDGMARFMQQLKIGTGDYSRDKDQILGNPTFEVRAAEGLKSRVGIAHPTKLALMIFSKP